MRSLRTLSRQNFNPEFQLAIATSTWPPGPDRTQRVDAALALPIDWDLFLRVVRRHRIEGLAFNALLNASYPMPPVAQTALQAAAERQASKSLLYAAETIRVCRILREAGIPVASLKGASLSMLAFGNLGLRHGRDIDLLVSPDDALRADEVLSSSYDLQMPIGPHSLPQKKHWIHQRKHFEYRERSKGIPLELHWRLFDNPRFFTDGSEPSTWMDVPILGKSSLQTLSTPDLLLYLCVHGANHMWFRLKWLADLQALLQQSGPKAVQQLEDDARSHHCERAVGQALGLTQFLYSVPPSERMSSRAGAVHGLMQSALLAMTSGDAASELETVPFGTSRLAWARYRLKPEWRFWLHETSSLLVDEHDRKSAHLPHSMRFFLPLLRLPLWLGRRFLGRGRSSRGY